MTIAFETAPQLDLLKSFELRVEAILKLGIEQFGLPVGIFSAISAENYEIRQVFHPENVLTAGMNFSLEETFCRHVISANDVIGIHDIGDSDLGPDGAAEKLGFAAYLGAPVQVDGECVGTLAFASPAPVAAFSTHNTELLRLFADSLGQALAHIRDHRELLRLATTDPVTGLYNRGYMEQLLRRELERSNRYDGPVVIGLVDFDNLKMLNDNFGYDAGDAALKLFAKVASEIMRETDVIARWGDKEFLVLMPETGAAGALNYLQRLTDRVRGADFHAGDSDLRLALSVGLGIAEQGDKLPDLIGRANVAMHESKQAGQDTIRMSNQDNS